MSRRADTLRGASRDFRCPGCSGTVAVVATAEDVQRVLVGRDSLSQPGFLHTQPVCAHFEAASTIEQILGPRNMELWGQDWEN